MAQPAGFVPLVGYREYPVEGVTVPDIARKPLAEIATFIEKGTPPAAPA